MRTPTITTALVVLALMVQLASAQVSKLRVSADLAVIAMSLETYKSVTGNYPTTRQGLLALVKKPTAPPVPKRWVMIMSEVPVDPWEREYQYELADGEVRLWSKGSDEKDSNDDIHHPSPEKPE